MACIVPTTRKSINKKRFTLPKIQEKNHFLEEIFVPFLRHHMRRKHFPIERKSLNEINCFDRRFGL